MTLGQCQEITLTLINYIPSLTPLVNFQVSDCNSTKISIVFAFSHEKPMYVSKIDIAIKKVKVILGSSSDQTMVGWSPRCYIPSFVEIGLSVLEMSFKGYLPYMGVAAILVM